MSDQGLAVRSMTRRSAVLDLGRGVLAVALGVAGCSSASSASSSGNSSGSSPTSAGAGSTGAGSATSQSADPAATARWERVNLGFVSAYVLVRGREAAVVDTGVSGSADAIGEVLTTAGPGWAGVRHVILTHYHGDHAGSVADVLGRATAATGHIGAGDLERVISPRPLQPAADGSEVFGLQIVATPGHTAGHVCVFDPQSGVLVAGDALTNTAGLAGSSPRNTADPAAAMASVRRLAALPVRSVLFGHGEPLQADAAAALARLAAG
jgi:glyoxylase-like metal-dependent hydrolase (beta-lactamase superfamily II)